MDEARLHDLLSGRRTDLSARVLRPGLQIASWLYGSATSLRNLGYDFKWLAVHRATVPVISLGNITTGGVGKTPFAAWLSNWLAAQAFRPGILSRGYRSLNDAEGDPTNDHSRGNDEKLVLDRLCPGVPHLQHPDRVRSAGRAVSEFGCNVLILDDGFQHRRLHRDLDLVLVDALRPWGYGHLLPRGLLRERLSGLRRADMILITRADQCSHDQLAVLRDQLAAIYGGERLGEIAFRPSRLVDQNWSPHPLNTVAGKTAFVFCGIGNPIAFQQTVRTLGLSCDHSRVFPDHHHYSKLDLSQLAEQAQAARADITLTTQKDLVKIPATEWNGPPLFAIEIGAGFLSGLDHLESRLRETLR